MKRVAVIGSGGAGKSTLTLKLSAKTGLPVVHLDRLYWREGWVPVSKEVWLELQYDLLTRERWIIDGNYGSTMDLRLAAADTVIFLDTPRLVCLWRVFKRWLHRHYQTHNRTRPDMTAGNPERLTGEFLRFVWSYPKQKPALPEKLGRLEYARVVHLRTNRDVRCFLKTI